MVRLPESGREKQISTNSLFFDSGQASLDICLSFECLGSSCKKIERIGKEYRQRRTACRAETLDQASNAIMRQ